jgi:hypothetical protein
MSDSDKNSPSPPIIIANFLDAYSLRNILSILRHMVTEVNLDFSSEHIRIIRDNATRDALIDVIIRTDQLSQYEMNAFTEEGKLVKNFEVGINTADIMKITKLAGRKDSMLFYINQADENLYVQISNTGKTFGDNAINLIHTKNVDHKSYGEIVYGDNATSVRISTMEFSKAFTAYITLKCKYVQVHKFQTGIQFKGVLPGGDIGRVDSFGDCTNVERCSSIISDEVTELLTKLDLKSKAEILNPNKVVSHSKIKMNIIRDEENYTIKIRMSMIKALSKLSSLSLSAIVKLTMEVGKSLEIICPIGSFGQVKINLRDAVV